MLKSSDLYLKSEKLAELLDYLGIKIVGETTSDFMVYCPFHHNVDSPALNISKKPGHPWKCWNAKCDLSGNIINLLTRKGYTRNEAKKLLIDGYAEIDDLTEYINTLLREEHVDDTGWGSINPEKFSKEDASNGYPGLRYLEDRGIQRGAYEYFGMGYSNKKKMLVIPIFNEFNRLTGVVGRSIEAKRYQYSKGFDRNRTVWNINNAKNSNQNYILLTEGTLDSVYLWQAEYLNVGAVFGSSYSPDQMDICRRYFDEIVCFFDNDEAGWALTNKIIREVKDLQVSAVEYVKDVKDPQGLTTEEIQYMVQTRRSAVELLLED